MTEHFGCLAVWPASPNCTGWHERGNPLHGCRLVSRGPHKAHECACGETVERKSAKLLGPPAGSNPERAKTTRKKQR